MIRCVHCDCLVVCMCTTASEEQKEWSSFYRCSLCLCAFGKHKLLRLVHTTVYMQLVQSESVMTDGRCEGI